MLTEELKSTRVVGALEACPGAITGGSLALGETTLEIDPARIVEVCRFLKTQDQFSRLSAVTAVDRYPVEPRFEVIYHLHSIARNERVRLKCRVSGESPQIDSVCEVWRGADWYEREVFDLFGIAFRHHPNLKRILLPDDWEGHPLRKDYPVHGFKYSYPQE